MTEKDVMLTSILKCQPIDLAVGSKKLTTEQECEFKKMTERRAQGEPLQYIVGHCDFMGTILAVDKRVLIPRPETELLVDLAIKKAKALSLNQPLNILDLGTGSGNIAITLVKNIPNCSVTALDIHEGSLALALKNAKSNNVNQKIEFVREDMTQYLQVASKQNIKFDMIVSNPPYIKTGELNQLPVDVQQEPEIALDGGKDGLKFYHSIIRDAHSALKSNGFLLLEIGDDQFEALELLVKEHSQYKDVSFHKDYVGTNRIVSAQLM